MTRIILLLCCLTSAFCSRRAKWSRLPVANTLSSGEPGCDFEYQRNGDWCYRFLGSSNKTDYDGAVKICKAEGANLASIHGEQENAFIVKYGSDVRIGLKYYKKFNHYRWSDGTPVDYEHLFFNFEFNAPWDGYCAKLNDVWDDGEWENAKCEEDKLPFVCKKKPSGITSKCGAKYTLHNGWCYRLSGKAEAATYEEALGICKSEDGNLASIHSKEEDDFLTKSYPNALIGMKYYKGTDKQFAWEDDSALDYKPFPSSLEENVDYFGYCIKVGTDGQWSSSECETDKLPFVCKKPVSMYTNLICPEVKVYEDYGEILSPGYPLLYHGSKASEDCHYNYELEAEEGELVEVILDENNLGNAYYAGHYLIDVIAMYEGWNTTSYFSWIEPSSPAGMVVKTKTLNRLLVNFRPWEDSTGRWRLRWSSVPKAAAAAEV